MFLCQRPKLHVTKIEGTISQARDSEIKDSGFVVFDRLEARCSMRDIIEHDTSSNNRKYIYRVATERPDVTKQK